MLITFSELAAIKGCSKAAVTHACKSRIAAAVVEENGKRYVDRDMALELWNRNTLRTYSAKVSAPDQIKLSDDQIPELNISRERREHYQAELAKLQVSQQRKELLPAEDIKKQAFQLGRTIREALANLADRLSHQLAGETDPVVIHKLLSDEHRAALMELSDDDL